MTDAQKFVLLKQALQLTEDMFQCAQNEQWDELTSLQQQRGDMLEHIFPLEPENENEQAKTVLEQIIAVNQQTEVLCREARQALQVEISGLNKNKKAVAAYRST